MGAYSKGGGLICKNDFLVGAYLRGEGLIRAWGLIRGLAVPLFYLIEMRGEMCANYTDARALSIAQPCAHGESADRCPFGLFQRRCSSSSYRITSVSPLV